MGTIFLPHLIGTPIPHAQGQEQEMVESPKKVCPLRSDIQLNLRVVLINLKLMSCSCCKAMNDWMSRLLSAMKSHK